MNAGLLLPAPRHRLPSRTAPRALLLSLLGHGLVLALPLALLAPPRMELPRMLNVVLAPSGPADATPKQPAPPSPSREEPHRRQQPPASPAARAALSVPAVPAAFVASSPAETATAPAAAIPPVVAATLAATQVHGDGPASTASTSAPPPAAAADKGEDAALARYAQALGELFARQQRYPRLAELRGWEGEVRLQLRIARKGALIDVAVTRSSGYDVLDRSALQLVQGNPLPPLPAVLDKPGEELRITVPIHYRLTRRAS